MNTLVHVTQKNAISIFKAIIEKFWENTGCYDSIIIAQRSFLLSTLNLTLASIYTLIKKSYFLDQATKLPSAFHSD